MKRKLGEGRKSVGLRGGDGIHINDDVGEGRWVRDGIREGEEGRERRRRRMGIMKKEGMRRKKEDGGE